MRLSTSGMFKTFDSSQPRGQYQELFETLGIVKSTSSRILPTSLRELKSEKKLLPDLSFPAGRKDAQALLKWLDSMLGQVANNSTDIESILESALSIYEVCFHEVVRQVSIQCKERGELISRVWKAYISLLERALRISQAAQQSQLSKFKQEKETLKAKTSAELIRLREELLEKNAIINNYNKKLQAKEEEMNRIEHNKQRLSHRLDIIISHYEAVKTEIVELKEEKRILKAKLLNTETEFFVNSHGIIEAQHKRQKIKRRSKENLERIVFRDPIISYGGSIDYSGQERLNEDIVRHEDELNEIFVQVDFVDQGIDAPVVVLESKENQTELEFVAGDCFGEGKDFVDTTSMVIELIDLNLQAMLTNQESNAKELKRQSTLKQVSIEPFLKDSRNTEKISVFLEKMKENIGAITNNHNLAVFTPNNGFSSSYKQQKSIDPHVETKRLKTIRKKMWNYIQESRLKKSSDVAYVLVQKIKNTPQHKLKKVVVKKILLKFISGFYEGRIQKRSIDQESRKQELSQFCLEYLSNKYGPGKIAESKMTQVLSSCIKYKHIKRVRVFSRFLRLFEELDSEDLDTYLDMQVFLKTSQGKDYPSSDYADQIIISYEKALDVQKSQLLHKLSDSDRKATKLWIESNKTIDIMYKLPTIDQDALFEFIINRSRSKKNARVNFLKCIYEAADLNEDGYLQQVEFDLLARHMAAFQLAEGFTTEIFKEFAETFTDEQENAVQALSFENFAMLSSTYEVFTIESMQNFSKITHTQGAIWHIKQVAPHIDQILTEIEWRLSKKFNWNEFKDEYGIILSVIKNKIITQKNPESVWIALRLLQEESKLICIERTLEALLPGVKNLVITSTNVL